MDRYLHDLRIAELESLRRSFPGTGRVLEIGAGNGWQAKRLSGDGYDVSAIDIANPKFASERAFEVREYDGAHIPFPDATFDVVFSSHVMEHLRDPDGFQREVQRVAKPGARIVHVIPSATWRLWSSVTHYIKGVVVLIFLLRRKLGGRVECRPGDELLIATVARTAPASRLRKSILPPRHGEFGNFMTETWYFCRWRWRRLFSDAGFTDVSTRSVGLFYTGYVVTGARLGFEARRRLGAFLGSSSIVYTMTNPQTEGDASASRG